MNISVLGCGRWGSCIAWYLDKIGNSVYSWGLTDAPDFRQLKAEHKNEYLSYSPSMVVSDDLEASLAHGEIIVISISSQNLRSFLQRVNKFNLDGKTFVLCMKGIEQTTGKRLSEVFEVYIDTEKTPVAVWVGPGHPQDYVRGIPNCMVIDSKNESVKKRLVDSFNSELIRFYLGNDLIGTEVGAAAKNVVGLAAGMLDGLGYTSLKGALMARGTREISRLISAMGGNGMSAYGLCHLGDYEATLFSKWSHNRMYGEMYVKGEKFEKLAEGVYTTQALLKLGDEYSVDLPIARAVSEVLKGDKNVREILSGLFMRSIKSEFE